MACGCPSKRTEEGADGGVLLYQTSTGPKVLGPATRRIEKPWLSQADGRKGTGRSNSAPSTVTRAVAVRQSSVASTRKVCWVGTILSVCTLPPSPS